jgi:hypothetical protein
MSDRRAQRVPSSYSLATVACYSIIAQSMNDLNWCTILDHGAYIERREQDYGATPLKSAVIRRQKRSIRTLVKRGADATRAMELAQRGLAGDYEDDASLDRKGYREIIELLRELGIGSR